MIYNNNSKGSSRDVRNLARLCIAKRGHSVGFVKAAALATVSTAALMLASAHATFAADQVAAAPAAATAEAAPEEIVVTGSRIVRDGYEAPTPVTVMSADDIAVTDAPTMISDYLTKMPAFANSATSRNSANSVGNSSSGQATLNLRAMGANRTLILFDGLRIAPSSVGTGGGAVDTNAIPDSLIQRIDVVAGGASSAYGSDALAGVVNFILDTKFTGVKGTLQGGTTIYNDDHEWMGNLTAGTGFADDRGHFLISGSITHIDGIDHGYRRPAIAENWDQINNPAYTATNGLPFYTVAKHVGSGLYSPGGLIASGPLKGVNFGAGGSYRMFNYGALSPGNNTMIGGDWVETTTALQDTSEIYTNSLDNRVWSQKLFSRVSYDITDDIHGYVQYMYSTNLSTAIAYSTTESVTIRSGNPFIPTAIQTQMTALGLASFVLGKSNYDDIGPMYLHNIRQLRQYTGGLNGKFDAFDQVWSWDAAYNRSETRQSTRTFNDTNKALYANAVDVVRNPTTGAPICRSTLTNPNDGCIPFNPMGTGVASPAQIEYALTGVSKLNQSIVQNEYSMNVHGEPVSLWAGPVSLAVGFEYRDQGVVGFSSALDDVNSFFAANYHPTNGSYSVAEGFVETLVPLAKDQAWAKSLDLNAAIRETGYSTSGTVTTWKVGATYDTPLTGFRVRAARSRDIRAPNLGELFSTGSPGQGNVVDAQKGNVITTNVITITQGNPNLAPEKADTTNIGVVYQPDWLPGFSASVDWHHINISGSIASLNAADEVAQCAAGVQVYCALIQRAPTVGGVLGALQLVYTAPANTAYYKQSGIDIEATYRQNLADISDSLGGQLTLHTLLTHYSDLTSVSPTGVITQGAGVNGSAGAPSWRYVLNVQYDINDNIFSWTGRGFSAGVISNNYTECTSACPTLVSPLFTISNNHLPAAFYMDAAYTHRFIGTSAGDFDVFIQAENITNKQSDYYAPMTAGNDIYEKLGTVFRSGIRFKM